MLRLNPMFKNLADEKWLTFLDVIEVFKTAHRNTYSPAERKTFPDPKAGPVWEMGTLITLIDKPDSFRRNGEKETETRNVWVDKRQTQRDGLALYFSHRLSYIFPLYWGIAMAELILINNLKIPYFKKYAKQFSNVYVSITNAHEVSTSPPAHTCPSSSSLLPSLSQSGVASKTNARTSEYELFQRFGLLHSPPHPDSIKRFPQMLPHSTAFLYFSLILCLSNFSQLLMWPASEIWWFFSTLQISFFLLFFQTFYCNKD